MKKLLLSAAVVAFASNTAIAESGQMYIKGSGGYTMNAKKLDVFGNKALSGFTGEIGLGYNLHDNLSVEGFVGYAPMSQAVKLKDATNLTLDNAKNDETLKKITGFDYNSQQSADSTNIKKSYKETLLPFGVKVNGSYSIAENLFLTAGIGAGAAYKTLELKNSMDVKVGTASVKASNTLKSKGEFGFYGAVNLGGEYQVTEGIFVGLGYSLQYSPSTTYKAKKEVKNTLINSADANKVTADAKKGTDNFFAKDAEMLGKGNSGPAGNHAFMASVKFAF